MAEYNSINRRRFVKQSIALAAASQIPFATSKLFAAANNDNVITILHTNDVHSHIDPFDQNDPKHPGLGGVARRAKIIQEIRRASPNVLLLDAGDIVQGTPYFNMYGGELEFKLMSTLGYDAATIGNHDFDNGIKGLYDNLTHANFQLLNSNYNFESTLLKDKIKPYKVFQKGEIKIGVFGVGIELKGLVDKKNYEEIEYNDPISSSQVVADYLRNDEKCDLIICLSHLGYKYDSDKVSDVQLAKKTSNIDLIIGGHTHTYLSRPDKVKNKEGKRTLVNQVGWAGIYLGRIDFIFDQKRINNLSTANVINISPLF